MRSDADIQLDVVEELRWTPDVDQTDIAVKVGSGVVALTGFVESFKERCSAERAVKRIAGVRALANDIEVRVQSAHGASDPQLARSAADAIERELPHSAQLIRITVENGGVTLEGVVDWQYEKERAEETLHGLQGLTGVTNLLHLKDRPIAADIKQQIGAALKRNAQVDADRIAVGIDGSEVTLTGKVHSWSEHEAAADIAWSAAGVKQVRNHISVGP